VTAHRLVMRVVRERLAADGMLAAVAAEAVQLLARLRGEITEAWRDPAGVRELADHISALTGCVQRHLNPPDAGLAAGLLQVRLGSVYLLSTLGDSTGQAIAVAGPLADDCAQTLGADHPGTLSAFTNLAYAYRAAGRTAEAIPLLKRTLADYERVPDTLTSRNNLARAYPAAGRTAEATPLYERTLADRERVLGADHPATRIVRDNLAELTRSASDGGATRS
jgi:predicted Zn-dependent protease